MDKRFDHEAIRALRLALPAEQRSRRAVVAAMAAAGKPISEQTLYRWELGENTPSSADLPALAAALGASIDDFFSPVCTSVAGTQGQSSRPKLRRRSS